MQTKSITANPSQIIIDQLVASGVKYVFYNSGSREAHFFDALHTHPDIHGILALHEGSVASMAGGYSRVRMEPAVMAVHLGAGLAQSLGQLINIWYASLPVVVITFAGDTGSYADRISLDLSHNVGPTSIAEPFTKASWTVIEPEGLPQAIHRAIQVAQTPPVGPVHLAVYDRMLDTRQVSTAILEGGVQKLRSGYPVDSDVETVAHALHQAKRPLLYVGDGVWKSGAERQVTQLAERFGLPVTSEWNEHRSVAMKHPLHCGVFAQAVKTINPDLLLCLGIRHDGEGNLEDIRLLDGVQQVIAIGTDIAYLKNPRGVDWAVLADERRTVERLLAWLDATATSTPTTSTTSKSLYDERRQWALTQAKTLRSHRREQAQKMPSQTDTVRPWVLADMLDESLETLGGGIIAAEQSALPIESIGGGEPGKNLYMRAAGSSIGYGVGGAIGTKLAAPTTPVVGLVGDGSLYYADSGLWTAVHHNIPLLYLIPNNGAYGVVATYFERAQGNMAQSGEYAGVALNGIDPIKTAESFGLEAMHVQDESKLKAAIMHGLQIVEEEQRPFLLNVQLPLGLPAGGRTAKPFQFGKQTK